MYFQNTKFRRRKTRKERKSENHQNLLTASNVAVNVNRLAAASVAGIARAINYDPHNIHLCPIYII